MIPAEHQPAVSRITITLDSSASGYRALETAVRLAVIQQAELEGIFVEDTNLLRLAGLPFLREVRPLSLAEEAISSGRMQRELRILARQAKQMLEQATSERGVRWTFQVWRGQPRAETLLQAFNADILSPGQVSTRIRSATGQYRPRRDRNIARVNILFSDSARATRALATAGSLASDLSAQLSVLLPAGEDRATQSLKDKATTILAGLNQPARIIQLGGTGIESLLQASGFTDRCILIAESEHALLLQTGLDKCLAALACPVFLVR
jgi:hypothetical protein